MVSMCAIVLALNAIGLTILLYLLCVFRKPLGIFATMALNVMHPPQPVHVPRPSAKCGGGDEEGMPPGGEEEEEEPGDEECVDATAAMPRKRLTFMTDE